MSFEESIPNTIKYPSNFERRKKQTALLDNINQDLISQTEKIQFLSKDINQISQKVRHTREISKEYKKVLNENEILKAHIIDLKKTFEKFECKNQELQNLVNKQQLRIDELEYHLRKKAEFADETEITLREMNEKYTELNSKNLEEREIYYEENKILKFELDKLNKILEEKERNITILKRDIESLRNLNEKITQDYEKNLLAKQNNEKESQQFYIEMIRLKDLFEEERTKNQFLTQERKESLILFETINEDYQRSLEKLSDLELRCEEQVKINNRLRDELNYDEVVNYKGNGIVY